MELIKTALQQYFGENFVDVTKSFRGDFIIKLSKKGGVTFNGYFTPQNYTTDNHIWVGLSKQDLWVIFE